MNCNLSLRFSHEDVCFVCFWQKQHVLIFQTVHCKVNSNQSTHVSLYTAIAYYINQCPSSFCLQATKFYTKALS